MHAFSDSRARRVGAASDVGAGFAVADLLACAADPGQANGELADVLGVPRPTVTKWCNRLPADRLDGLLDEPRPGRPRTIADADVERVITTTMPKKSLTTIDREVLDDPDVRVVLDDVSTHETPAVKRRLAAHPRFVLHFTPTSSSRLNLVERWFAELTTKPATLSMDEYSTCRHIPRVDDALDLVAAIDSCRLMMILGITSVRAWRDGALRGRPLT